MLYNGMKLQFRGKPITKKKREDGSTWTFGMFIDGLDDWDGQVAQEEGQKDGEDHFC